MAIKLYFQVLIGKPTLQALTSEVEHLESQKYSLELPLRAASYLKEKEAYREWSKKDGII